MCTSKPRGGEPENQTGGHACRREWITYKRLERVGGGPPKQQNSPQISAALWRCAHANRGCVWPSHANERCETESEELCPDSAMQIDRRGGHGRTTHFCRVR